MTPQEALEVITNAVQTDKMTAEQDKALAIAQKALEKQIPKKLYSWNCTIREDFYKVECPECLGSHITRIRPDCCMECGQRFDWSEIDELLNKE